MTRRIEKSIEDTNTKIFEKKENGEKKPYVCQYIVCAGSNEDFTGMSGIAHFIEHFVIHTVSNEEITKTIKIHGFTSFYYTCYYWYVETIEQGKELFDLFDKIIERLKNSNGIQEMFLGTKSEIVNEICYHKQQTIELENTVNLLIKFIPNIHIPIGKEDEVKSIQSEDIKRYLKTNYVFSKIHKYMFDNERRVYLYQNLQLKTVKIELAKFKYDIVGTRSAFLSKEFKFIVANQKNKRNDVKFFIINKFSWDFWDVLYSEIFMMQICKYLQDKIEILNDLSYENLFIDSQNAFFVITIKNIETEKFSSIIEKLKYIDCDILSEIMDRNSFKKFRLLLTKYLSNYDIKSISEKEIIMSLINYAAFDAPSIWFLKNRNDAIEMLNSLKYEQYYARIANILTL